MVSGLLVRAGVSKHSLAECHLLAQQVPIRSSLIAFCLCPYTCADTDDGSVLVMLMCRSWLDIHLPCVESRYGHLETDRMTVHVKDSSDFVRPIRNPVDPKPSRLHQSPTTQGCHAERQFAQGQRVVKHEKNIVRFLNTMIRPISIS